LHVINWLQEKKSAVFGHRHGQLGAQLPPELLRKGRFDEIFFVDLPQRGERKEIFDIHILKRKRSPATSTATLSSRLGRLLGLGDRAGRSSPRSTTPSTGRGT